MSLLAKAIKFLATPAADPEYKKDAEIEYWRRLATYRAYAANLFAKSLSEAGRDWKVLRLEAISAKNDASNNLAWAIFFLGLLIIEALRVVLSGLN